MRILLNGVQSTMLEREFCFQCRNLFLEFAPFDASWLQTPVNNQGDQGKKIVGYVKDDPRIQRITKNLQLTRLFKFLVQVACHPHFQASLSELTRNNKF